MHFVYEKDVNLGGQRAECYGTEFFPQNLHVETLTNVTVFGDGAFKKVINN